MTIHYLLVLFFPFVAFAQHDTTLAKTYVLPEVKVEGLRSKNFSTGQRLVFADSAGLSNRASYTLAEQLAFGNSINIRTYGAGGLATLSLQGSSAVHSAVVWNGFNVQSIMNGTSDLSLSPTFFVDELGLQSGSATHLWGSGAVGGSVLLNNKPAFGKGLLLKSNTEMGSFGRFSQQAKVAFGTQKWYGSIKGFYTEAENNYQLTTNNYPLATIRNSAMKQKGVLAENYVRWRNNSVAMRLWLQDNFRQNPPSEINGKLKDKTSRANVEYQKNGQKWHWFVRSAWLRENLVFFDPLREENSTSLADVFIGETELRWSPSARHLLNIGINGTHQQASVITKNYGVLAALNTIEPDKYGGNPSRQMLAAFAQYKYTSENARLVWQFSARQEMVRNATIPLVPSTGLEFKPAKWMSLKANVARFFRLPTFNELFWKPGGNPNLLPESGWNAEVSMCLMNDRPTTTSFYEIAVYNREINNWIRWSPDVSYWSAKNVARVHTQGIENRIGTNLKIGKSNVKILASTAYVVSTNRKTSLENDQSLGLQLIFVPMYQGNGNINYRYKGFYAEYNHSYTGYTYIANDHSSWLNPFHVGNVMTSQSFNIMKYNSCIFFRINNLWNAHYKTVAAYPMPPRNYQIGITFQFN